LPPTRVEYVEKQPSLEDVFLALVGRGNGAEGGLNDTAAARSPRTTEVER
jgi:ABC-2 type transport system ATP-binding protein